MSIGPFDWNGNGKHDLFDAFMDMKVMEDCEDTSNLDEFDNDDFDNDEFDLDDIDSDDIDFDDDEDY